jgi:hypothetical protein
MAELIKAVNWEEAKAHVDAAKETYLSLSKMPGANVSFVLNFVINPLLRRYESGERTDELYGEMMNVE